MSTRRRASRASLLPQALNKGPLPPLDLSIAVASKRLQRLEQELGVRLLHRTTRHVHATAEGVALADQGRKLVEDLESLTSGLGRGGIEVTGTLRVSTSPTFPAPGD